MERKTTTSELLTWDFDQSGTFEVLLENNQIKSLSMCLFGTHNENCLHSTDLQHLKNIHKALGETLAYIERDLGSPIKTTEEIYEEEFKQIESLGA